LTGGLLFWLLAIGYWLLAIGYWLIITHRAPHIRHLLGLFEYINHFYLSLIHETFHQAPKIHQKFLFLVWSVFRHLDDIY